MGADDQRRRPRLASDGHESAHGDAVRPKRRGSLAQRGRVHECRGRGARRQRARRRSPETCVLTSASMDSDSELATVARETFEYGVIMWAGRKYGEWVRAWS